MKAYNAVEFLNEILSIQSVNGSDDEGKVARFLHNYFISCGVDSRIQEIDKTHANILAQIQGKSDKVVIWNGHLDTVPYGNLDEWNSNPAIPYEKNGNIYARGSSDMKSGLAAMAYVLGQMKKQNIIPKDTIKFWGTCDEEKNGLGAKKLLMQEEIGGASLLLVGEPTGCRLGIAQKGCIWLALDIEGKTSHGAYPKEGINAVEYGIAVVQELREYVETFDHEVLGNTTLQITKISGGIAPNMTPDRGKLVMDIRVVPGLNSQMVIKELERICQEYNRYAKGKANFQIKILNDRKAIEFDKKNEWMDAFSDAIMKEHVDVEEIGINYFTDASILIEHKSETPVLLFGPGEPNQAHKPNEHVSTAMYQRYIKLLLAIFS